jgi:hypothetical protein
MLPSVKMPISLSLTVTLATSLSEATINAAPRKLPALATEPVTLPSEKAAAVTP